MTARSPQAIARERARNRERSREYQRNLPREVVAANNLRVHHGLTPTERRGMLDAQGGRCFLCGDELAYDQAVIDHDHSCCPRQGFSCARCRRGLACEPCNLIIGMAGDDPERLIRIGHSLAAVLPTVRAQIAGKPQQLTLDVNEVEELLDTQLPVTGE